MKAPNLTECRRYDARGRLQWMDGRDPGADCDSPAAAPIVRFDYGYDERGNRKTETYQAGGPTELTQYGYDPADRLTSVVAPSGAETTYGLLGDGSRNTVTTAVTQGGLGSTESYHYDARGGLTGTTDDLNQPVATYTVDVAGRVLSEARAGRSKSFTWDAGGRLTAASVTVDGTTTASSFRYDRQGLRIWKQGPAGETTYLWGAGELAEEVLPSGTRLRYERGAGLALAVGGETLLHDGLGSVVGRVGAGAPVMYRYDAWGSFQGTAAPTAGEASLAYAGQHWDADVGLVEDHESRCRLEREGVTKLLRDPGGGRARRDGAADDVAPAVADDEEHLEDAERRRGHGEEVHGGDAIPVVPEEGRPGLAGSRGARQGAQVARDAALGDVEAEAQQFPVDAGRAPGILRGHPPDESADLAREGRAAGARAASGQPVPVDAEAGAVPAHDRVWPDDGEALGPAAPEAAQQDPEDPIGGPDVGVSSGGQGDELLAEGQVLDHEVASRAHGRAERRQEGHEEAKHRAGENPGPWPNRQWFQHGRDSGEGQAKPPALTYAEPTYHGRVGRRSTSRSSFEGAATRQAARLARRRVEDAADGERRSCRGWRPAAKAPAGRATLDAGVAADAFSWSTLPRASDRRHGAEEGVEDHLLRGAAGHRRTGRLSEGHQGDARRRDPAVQEAAGRIQEGGRVMNKAQKARFAKAGWKLGTAADVLGLSDAEAALVEAKLRLGDVVRTVRQRRHLSQAALAKLMGSSQSRVAKVENRDTEVSLDLQTAGHLRCQPGCALRTSSGSSGSGAGTGSDRTLSPPADRHLPPRASRTRQQRLADPDGAGRYPHRRQTPLVDHPVHRRPADPEPCGHLPDGQEPRHGLWVLCRECERAIGTEAIWGDWVGTALLPRP